MFACEIGLLAFTQQTVTKGGKAEEKKNRTRQKERETGGKEDVCEKVPFLMNGRKVLPVCTMHGHVCDMSLLCQILPSVVMRF